jgi:hypothetical protein
MRPAQLFDSYPPILWLIRWIRWITWSKYPTILIGLWSDHQRWKSKWFICPLVFWVQWSRSSTCETFNNCLSNLTSFNRGDLVRWPGSVMDLFRIAASPFGNWTSWRAFSWTQTDVQWPKVKFVCFPDVSDNSIYHDIISMSLRCKW